MSRALHLVREIGLTLGAILGVISIIAALASVFFGITPLIFRSGSMAPLIETGALAIAQRVPAADIRVHDIISATDAHGTRVTHRVEAIDDLGGGSVALTMRGDANSIADADPYVLEHADRILWHANGLGFVLQEAQKPQWVFLVGLFVGGMLIVSTRSRRGAGEAGTGADLGVIGAGETSVAEVGLGRREMHDPEVGAYRAAVQIVPAAVVGLDAAPAVLADPGAVPARRHARPFTRPWIRRAARTPRPLNRDLLVRVAALCAISLLGAGTVAAVQARSTLAVFTSAVSADRAVSVPVDLQPTAVTCTLAGSALSIGWTGPAAGEPPLGYTVTVGELAAAAPPPTPAAATTAHEAVLNAHDLTPGTAYRLTVSASHFTDWLASATLGLTLDPSLDSGVTCG